MDRLRRLPWLRIFAEGAAIVASILLAFWIQAWWEGRQERNDERAALTSLLREFQKLKAIHDWSVTYNLAIRDSIRELTNAAVGPENTLDDRDVDRLVADLYWNQDLSLWAAPVLSAVVFSGDLELITNSTLRQKLGEWPIRLETVRGVLQRDLKFFNDHQMPLLAETMSLAQIVNADDGAPGHPEQLYDGGRQIVLKSLESHMDVLSSRAFQNMLVQRDVWITDILFLGYAGVPENLDETIALLEQELASTVDE